MLKDIKLLGLKVRDRVTGFEGIVASVCFDLYGCVQAIITPAAKDGKIEDSRWFDTKRLYVLDPAPVLEQPTFETVEGPKVDVRGPEAKSIPRGF